MALIEALRSEALDLPLDRSDEHFPSFMKKVFDRYLDEVEHLANHAVFDVCKNDVTFLCETIVASIDAYYNGFPSNAYLILEEGLNRIVVHLNRLIDVSVAEPADELNLFKLRVNGKRELKREDMFHVPFEKREFISMQRYNIPGLPCLYLGNSISVCWEEMQRPDIASIHVSRYRLNVSELHFLDISLTPSFILEMYNKNKECLPLVISFLTTWPLVAACSVNVLNNKAAFNPEYIIPQLLLQWIRKERRIDGIKYLCTRVKEDYKTRPKGSINYVIPCKKMAPRGFCNSLAKKIKLTMPVSLSVLPKTEGYNNDCNYIFRQMEEYLEKMELGAIGEQ